MVSTAKQGNDEEDVVGVRSRLVGMVGVLLALGACGQTNAADHGAPTSSSGGELMFAVSRTCTTDSEPHCEVVGDEHVVVNPSDFAQAGVATATPADDSSAAVDVVFDAEGAAAFSKASGEVAQKGDSARLVLRVDDHVLSAVRVPSSVAVTKMRIALPDHLHADDIARQITDG